MTAQDEESLKPAPAAATASSSQVSGPHHSTSGSSLGSLPDKMEVSSLKIDQNSTVTEASSGSLLLTLVAKFKKERFSLTDLPADTTTIADVKEMLQECTRILPKRQKLVGLTATQGGAKGVVDTLLLADLKRKEGETTLNFILMGTPEEQIFVDPHERDDLPDVVDDFDLDFNAGSEEWLNHVATGENLKKFTEHTEVFFMDPPRPNKPLLVLDLDHTLLDFSRKTLQQDTSVHIGQGMAATMKRPYMDAFLEKCYPHYDLVVWSQTSWRWLETKLTELGMLTHPGYKFCFVLDKTSMFTIKSTKRDQTSVTHHVKPLQIIWSKFPQWGPHNTVHLDDLSRNFALNLSSGIKVKAYYRKKSKARADAELLGLGSYLQTLALSGISFDSVDFRQWQEVASGSKNIQDTQQKDDSKK